MQVRTIAANVPGLPYNQFANNYPASNGRPSNISVQQQQVLHFRPSPFYEIVERLSNVATLPCEIIDLS